MLEAEQFVKAMMKASNCKPRLKKSERVILPTGECPLPDFINDDADIEWLVLCYLVHSPLNKES